MDVEVFRMGGGVGLESFQRFIILQDLYRVRAHSLDITYIIEKTGFALDGDLGQSAGIGGDDGHTRGHGFECGEAEAFVFGREEEEVGDGEDLFHLFLFADEAGVVADIEFAAKALGAGAFGAVTDEE